jgi:hypothetical protein
MNDASMIAHPSRYHQGRMADPDLDRLRAAIVTAGARLSARGLVVAAEGNLADERTIWNRRISWSCRWIPMSACRVARPWPLHDRRRTSPFIGRSTGLART